MPLPSSFWADEMVTAFVVRHGAAEPTLHIAPRLGASVYYALPHTSARLFGFSEWAYRLPSLLALALALWIVARIATRLLHSEAGWFAVFCCLAFPAFDQQAADARPYALGTCVVCAAVWFLVRWLEGGRWRDAILFALAAALVIQVHLVFWPMYLVFALIAAFRRPASVAQTLVVCGAITTSLAIAVPPALSLIREAGAHVVMDQPAPKDLLSFLQLAPVAIFAIASGAFAKLRGWKIARPASTALVVIAAWWLVDPLSLFAFSRLTGNSVFVPRYMDVALPGTALALAAFLALFLPVRMWRPLSLALGTGVLIFMGNWSRLWPDHENSDWRAAAQVLRQSALPVLCPSPFVEARPPIWRPDYPIESFLYSNLLVYPVPGKLYPFPYDFSPEAERAARRLWSDTLSRGRGFAIFGIDRQVMPWREWFRALPDTTGWRDRKLGGFGNVSVVVFEPPTSPLPSHESAASPPTAPATTKAPDR